MQWRTQKFCSGGVQQIQLRTERTGIWGAVAPSQGFWRQLLFGTRNLISYGKILLIFGTLCLRHVMPWREKKPLWGVMAGGEGFSRNN